jgi:acyl-coenzyme A synthetase/AMP-(fatty) acid ligase
MTETGAGGCFMVTEEPRHLGTRCIGRPPPSIEYRIVDDEHRDVGRNEPGELLVRAAGPDPRRGFFSGYHGDESATSALWAGGWLHSGDVVVKGASDSLFFVDRKKNIIRRSGENIAVAEVENALLKHPAVSGCAVAPVLDLIRGEEVFACIVPSKHVSGTQELANVIHTFCCERLAYYKTPGYVAFVSAIPTTATQKISRSEVKQLVARILATGDCFDLRDQKRRPKLRQEL